MQTGIIDSQDKNTGADGRGTDRNVYCVFCKMPIAEDDLEHFTVITKGVETAGLPFFGWVHKCCLSEIQQKPDADA
jgi:hypothetical protein